MLLAEELKAEPVWVFNSGNSHTEYIPNDKLHPFVEDVLQSIEFVTGAVLWRMPVGKCADQQVPVSMRLAIASGWGVSTA